MKPPYNLPFIAKRASNDHTWMVVDATYQVLCAELDEHEATWIRDQLNTPAPVPSGDGWVSVPREPTVDMVERGREQLSQGDAKVQTHARVMWVWEAMIAASPTPPAAVVDAGKAKP